jgi:hypothetical protein
VPRAAAKSGRAEPGGAPAARAACTSACFSLHSAGRSGAGTAVNSVGNIEAPSSPIADYLADLHARLVAVTEGRVADYIPELSKADPNWFGIAVATTDGTVYAAGDAEVGFSIQSVY